MAYGDYIAGRSFNVDISGNFTIYSIGIDGFLYGLDTQTTQPFTRQIIVFQLSSTGATRVSARDFVLPSNYRRIDPPGNRDYAAMDIDGGFLYVVGADSDNSNAPKVFVFELTSTGGNRVTAREWNLDVGNSDPSCLAIYEGIAYIGDLDGTFYAYTLAEDGATRATTRDWVFQNRRLSQRVTTAGGTRYRDTIDVAAGLEIDRLGLAYIAPAEHEFNNVNPNLYTGYFGNTVLNGASQVGSVRVYEIVPTGAIRRASRDFSLQSGTKNGIAIDNGFVYVSEHQFLVNGLGIEVYEHYPSPPEFPTDVGPAQTFVVNEDITPFTIPDAGGVPDPRYSIVGLPNGVTFNATTRVVSGRPTATGQGTATVTADNRPQS
ncbi:MAG: hypothetical protein OXC91_12105 [Rhodobacteraceae bacterium]|nr:hypothetical protein [Paracoccaceae bacterium]